MIIGIGTDMTEVERIQRAVEKSERFLSRNYTEREINYCKEKERGIYQSLTGKFAAKEAVAKALGTGIRGFSFKDIEVMNDDLGKPFIQLHGGALERMKLVGGERLHISISHTKALAIAYVILEA